MRNLSFEFIQKVRDLIGNQFDSITLRFLGLIPQVSKDKKLIITSKPNSLTSLFLQALGNREPEKSEEEVLKGLLNVANSYMEALKTKTQARVVNEITAYSQGLVMKDKPLKAEEIKAVIDKELESAQNHMKLIANAETQRASNTGTAMEISRIGKARGNEDPTVFFAVTQDDVTGEYEYILHLMPDRKTPVYWKLSEIIAEYYKPGGQYPSLCGLHPFCRCKLTYLAKGYGHVDGKITFMGFDYDGFEEQRGKYGLPNVPAKISRKKSK